MIFLITIVLDGMNFLPAQLAMFNRLKSGFRWIVVEGTSKATHCTGWCADVPPGLSKDGSHYWLKEMAAHHPNVIHAFQDSWDGKIAMFNRATRICAELAASHPNETHTVMEIDADEMWQAEQLDKIHNMFSCNPSLYSMKFWCRYFVGPNLIITSRGTYGNHGTFEWQRAWRWFTGFHFIRHEPPVTTAAPVNGALHMTCDETESAVLSFDHQAYFYETQVRQKEVFYQYKNAVQQWKRLQACRSFPVRVGDYLEWVKDRAMCDRIYK